MPEIKRTRVNNMSPKKSQYLTTVLVTVATDERIKEYAQDRKIPKQLVYGAFLSAALLEPANRKLMAAELAAREETVIPIPSRIQLHMGAMFDSKSKCERTRKFSKQLVQSYRDRNISFFAYHVIDIACQLCLQGQIQVPEISIVSER